MRLPGAVLLLSFVVTACGRDAEAPPEPAASAPRAAAEPGVAAFFDDATTTARVKASLLADPDVNGFDVDVSTSDATVTLTGRVASDAERERAARIARELEGVRDVKNALKVAAAPAGKPKR